MIFKRYPSHKLMDFHKKIKVYVIFGKEGGREPRPVC